MKKIIFAFILLLLPIISVAQSNSSNDKPTDKRPVLLTKSVPQSTRPQSPSRQEISCEYGNGCLFISFLYSEGVCSLSVTEGGEETQVYDFDSSSEAVIFVGELTSANITITTEYGHTYKGTL